VLPAFVISIQFLANSGMHPQITRSGSDIR
jgi:hypothetical protein